MIQFLPQSMSFLVKLEILDLGNNSIRELVGGHHHRITPGYIDSIKHTVFI
jgi:hypothetical protein